MNLIFFIVIISIGFYSSIKKPGFVLAYLFFFQNLNKLLFEQIDLGQFRYTTSIFFFIIIYSLHLKKNDVQFALNNFIKNKILRGYLILVIYMILSAMFIGTSYEYNYLMQFLFPGFILFVSAALLMMDSSIHKDFFYGIMFFAVFTAAFLIFFKGIGALSDRTFAEDTSNISAITQGRMSGLLALFSIIIILYNKRSDIKNVAIIIAILSIIWLTMTGTRGSLVSLVLSLIFFLVFSGNRKISIKYFILGSAIIVPILIYYGISESLLFSRTSELLEPGDIQNMTRFYRWEVFFNELPKYFLFGAGPGGWSKQIWGGKYRYPHNIIIEFVIEYGLVGLISFLLIYITSFSIAITIIKDRRNDVFSNSIVLGWVFYSISVMFSGGFVQGNESFFTYTGIMAGLLYNLNKMSVKKNKELL